MDAQQHDLSKIECHEKSAIHQTLFEHRSHGAEAEQPSEEDPATLSALPPLLTMADHATRNLLQSLAGISGDRGESGPLDTATHSPSPPFLDPVYGWGQYTVNEDTKLVQSAEQEGIALITKSLLDHFDELSGSESEQERSDVDKQEVQEPVVAREYMIKCIYQSLLILT